MSTLSASVLVTPSATHMVLSSGSVEGITPIHNWMEVSPSTAYDMETHPIQMLRSY